MLLALALAGSMATAGELSIEYEAYELENGLDVILAPDLSTPIVHVNVWYHVGSRNEEKGLTGFAHLFEHLMFQGSEGQPGEYFAPLDAVGASLNGTTNTDRTNYFETVPAEFLPLALFLESDRMGYLLPVLTQDKLDNQREVVKNERRQRYENPPFGDAWVHLTANLWPEGHPYQHTTIGSHEDLENASLDDVTDFFQTWYVPNNAALVVAGNFDKEVAKAKIEEYFAGIPRGEDVPHWEPAPAPLASDVEIRLFQDVPEQRVWIAWPSPAIYEPGDAELDLLNATLAGGKDGRLYQELVQKRGIAKRVTAYQASSMLASTYVIEATAAEGHTTDELVQVIDEVMKDTLSANPPTVEDIAAAQANYEAGFYGRISTISGKANLLQFYHLVKGEADWITEDIARYDSTPEKVVAESKIVLDQPRVVMHIWPDDSAKSDNSDDPNSASSTYTFWQKLFGKKPTAEEGQ